MTRSGLTQPSGEVGPTLLKSFISSSLVDGVAMSSRAPAVITSGSSPGERMVPLNGPALPAEATTAIPEFHTASTAWSRGLMTVDWWAGTPREMLRTLMPYLLWWSTAHCRPEIKVPRWVVPSAPATLIDTSLAPGASPEYWPPEEAPSPAIRPATKVPWP